MSCPWYGLPPTPPSEPYSRHSGPNGRLTILRSILYDTHPGWNAMSPRALALLASLITFNVLFMVS
jgi:hypothetical protein